MHFWRFWALTLLVLTGCAQVEIVPPKVPAPVKEPVALAVQVADVPGLVWNVGDSISVFSSADTQSNQKFACTAKEGTQAVFEGSCVPGQALCAIYPFQEEASLYVDGTQFVLDALLPAVQEAGTPSNLYVAVAPMTQQPRLDFQAACATVRLELVSEAGEEAVTAVSVKGNNGENLSGRVKVLAAQGAAPSLLQSAAMEGSAAELHGTWSVGNKPVYIDVNLGAQTLKNGVTVSVTKADGVMTQKSFDQNMVFKSNEVATIPQFLFEGPKYYIGFTAETEVELPGYKVVWDAQTKEGKIFLDKPVIVENFLLDNTQITSLFIPAFITEIQTWGCRRMSALKKVVFEEGSCCKEFGTQAFQACAALVGTFTIPASVEYIGKGCFNGCSALTEIHFEQEGARITEIVDNAFNGVNALNKPVIIPASIKTMGTAFNSKYTKKIVLHCLAPVPPIVPDANFVNVKFVEAIYVPAASLAAYKAAWAPYAQFIKPLP